MIISSRWSSRYEFYFIFFLYFFRQTDINNRSNKVYRLSLFLFLSSSYICFIQAFAFYACPPTPHSDISPTRVLLTRVHDYKEIVNRICTHWIGLIFFRRFRVDCVYARTRNAIGKQRWFHASEPVVDGVARGKYGRAGSTGIRLVVGLLVRKFASQFTASD